MIIVPRRQPLSAIGAAGQVHQSPRDVISIASALLVSMDGEEPVTGLVIDQPGQGRLGALLAHLAGLLAS